MITTNQSDFCFILMMIRRVLVTWQRVEIFEKFVKYKNTNFSKISGWPFTFLPQPEGRGYFYPFSIHHKYKLISYK